MAISSRGFSDRCSAKDVKLPPGQYLTTDFVSRANTNRRLDHWEFVINDGPNVLRRWDWRSFRDLPTAKIVVDLQCVTRWSKLGRTWEGVSLDTMFVVLKIDADYALVRSYDDYTTNMPLHFLLNRQAWITFRFDGEDLAPEHGVLHDFLSRNFIYGRAQSGSGASP